jgi:hypothetical protein
MSNTSATGGYLLPTTTVPLPSPSPGAPAFTLTQFIQSVLVGLTGIDGTLVRPKWQINPPKQPDIGVDWIAFKVTMSNPDTYSYNTLSHDEDDNPVYQYQRQEDLTLSCAFYGPNSREYGSIVIDGFQIGQNLEALQSAGLAFTSSGQLMLMPDLVNERWVEKYELEILMRREIQRTYSILSILEAQGTIISDSPPKTVVWNVNS